MKKLLYAFLIAAVAAVHSGCKDDEETFVHVEKVSIDVRELHLNPGKTYQAILRLVASAGSIVTESWYVLPGLRCSSRTSMLTFSTWTNV